MLGTGRNRGDDEEQGGKLISEWEQDSVPVLELVRSQAETVQGPYSQALEDAWGAPEAPETDALKCTVSYFRYL